MAVVNQARYNVQVKHFYILCPFVLYCNKRIPSLKRQMPSRAPVPSTVHCIYALPYLLAVGIFTLKPVDAMEFGAPAPKLATLSRLPGGTPASSMVDD